MLEVRSFEGSPEELSAFVATHWKASYGGQMAIPLWSADYFRWQLRMDEPEFRHYLLAAYDGSSLAGVVMHFPMEFAFNDTRFRAAQASWLSVSAQYRGQGVAAMLIQESRDRLRDMEFRFQLGFAYYGHRSSRAPKFWLRSQSATTTSVRKVGFWVRVLDPAQSVSWNSNAFERWATRLATPVLGTPKIRVRPNLLIRKAEQRDLEQCLNLAELSTQHCPLRLVWDAESMSRQLGLRGFSHALVAEEDGELRGCITFHILPIINRTEALFGIIDLVLVSQLSPRARLQLLNSALLLMKELGAISALKMRSGDYPRSLFMGIDWAPRPADSHVIVTWADKPERLPRLGRMHVLWR